MADVYVELERMWKRLCRDSGVIFNFLLGHNGDTLFAGRLDFVLCYGMTGMGVGRGRWGYSSERKDHLRDTVLTSNQYRIGERPGRGPS